MKGNHLHLLPHFAALMNQASVSKAADQLGISQPSMSAALSRLRYIFGDPLLTREGNRWILTERARSLHRSFGPLLETWIAESARADSLPRTQARVFDLYASDYIQFALLPAVVGKLKQAAPHLLLRVLPPKLYGTQEMLTENHVHLYLGYYPDPPGNLRARYLFEESACCLTRNKHPVLGRRWNLDAFLQHEHMDAVGHAGYFNAKLDEELRAQGRYRQVGTVLSSYLALPFVLAQSDMIALLPCSVARSLSGIARTTILPAPMTLPSMRIAMFWHERYHNDSTHAWVRNFIAAQMRAPNQRPAHRPPSAQGNDGSPLTDSDDLP